MLRPRTKSKPSRLQIALDQEIGFVNRIDSRINKISRTFDNNTGEYVIWIEQRTRVKPGIFKEQSDQKPLISVLSDIFQVFGRRCPEELDPAQNHGLCPTLHTIHRLGKQDNGCNCVKDAGKFWGGANVVKNDIGAKGT